MDIPKMQAGVGQYDFLPDLDCYDVHHNIHVDVDLPGVSKDDLALSFRDGNLIISGTRHQKDDVRAALATGRERNYGTFRRAVFLPAGCDIDNITAKFDDLGVLKIVVPRGEAMAPTKISIE